MVELRRFYPPLIFCTVLYIAVCAVHRISRRAVITFAAFGNLVPLPNGAVAENIRYKEKDLINAAKVFCAVFAFTCDTSADIGKRDRWYNLCQVF